MDDTVKHLARLLRSGAITPQTYVEGLSALAETPPTPAPRQRREPPTLAPSQQSTPAKAYPDPAPASHPAPRDVPTAEMDAYIEEILSEMPGERPIPAPRRRRPIPAPRQLVFRRTRWVIGSFLRGRQMNVPQGHPHGADPRAFLEGVRPQIRDKLEEEIKALNGIKFQLALKVQLRKDNPDAVRSTQTLYCATSRRLFCITVKSRGASIKLSPRSKKLWRSGRREGQAGL